MPTNGSDNEILPNSSCRAPETGSQLSVRTGSRRRADEHQGDRGEHTRRIRAAAEAKHKYPPV
jgi:hypothetical protein